MSLTVSATIGCGAVDPDRSRCRLSVTVRGSAGVNATTVRHLAETKYGWVTTKGKERCFDHRPTPLDFHDFVHTGSAASWGDCQTCGRFDQTGSPNHAAHRKERVMPEVEDLRRTGIAMWDY